MALTRFLILIFGLSLGNLQAQTTREFEVEFESDCWLESFAYSEEFALKLPPEVDFTGLSAFAMNPRLEVELQYRLKHNQQWGDWQAIAPNNHDATSDRKTYVAEPVYEPFSHIQFRSSDSLDIPVIFRLFLAGVEKKSPEASLPSSTSENCSCPPPAYCGRSCWCPDGNCSTGYTPTPTQSTHIIVHHSAGFNASSDFKAVVAYYWDLHVNTNGWDDIGYNWLIDGNGRIYEGRGSGNTGSHFSCMNSQTTGICMIGNFENHNPTVLAKEALKNLLAWEACDKTIALADSSLHSSSQLILRHVSGHRDGNVAQQGCPSGTVCPGGWLYQQIPAIVSEVAGRACLGGLSMTDEKAVTARVYPNPFQTKIQLSWPSAQARQLSVYNLQGQPVKRFFSRQQQVELRLSNLPAGSYILKISSPDQISVQHIVKN